jgi:hypothetical protein
MSEYKQALDVDFLDEAIRFARGIEAAIAGLDCEEQMRDGVVELQRRYIDYLTEMREREAAERLERAAARAGRGGRAA